MQIDNVWYSFKAYFRRIFRRRCCKDTLLDTIHLDLWGLHIGVSRELPKDVPYELTVVVPRTELRKKCDSPKKTSCDTEILLNSITIAHSPRFEGTERRLPVIPVNHQEK